MTVLKQHFVTLPGLGVALLPKAICPLCVPVYLNVLTSLGLGFLLSSKYLFSITLALLLIAVSTLAFRSRQRRGLLPCELGLAASALILAGKFGLDSHSMMYGGVVLLVSASVWNAWPLKRIETCCERCRKSEYGITQTNH
jgi:mercuric ion transport protein